MGKYLGSFESKGQHYRREAREARAESDARNKSARDKRSSSNVQEPRNQPPDYSSMSGNERRELFLKEAAKYKDSSGAIKPQYLSAYREAYNRIISEPGEAETLKRSGIAKPAIQAPKGTDESQKSYEARTAGIIGKSAQDTADLFAKTTGRPSTVSASLPQREQLMSQAYPESIASAQDLARAKNLDLAASDYNLQVQSLSTGPSLLLGPQEQKDLEKKRESVMARLDTDINVQKTPTGYMSVVPGYQPFATSISGVGGKESVSFAGTPLTGSVVTIPTTSTEAISLPKSEFEQKEETVKKTVWESLKDFSNRPDVEEFEKRVLGVTVPGATLIPEVREASKRGLKNVGATYKALGTPAKEFEGYEEGKSKISVTIPGLDKESNVNRVLTYFVPQNYGDVAVQAAIPAVSKAAGVALSGLGKAGAAGITKVAPAGLLKFAAKPVVSTTGKVLGTLAKGATAAIVYPKIATGIGSVTGPQFTREAMKMEGFGEVMKRAYEAEQQAQSGKGPFVGTLYEISPLTAGGQVFREAAREEFKRQGLTGAKLEAAVNAAERMKTYRGAGEAAAIAEINKQSELLGRNLVRESVARGAGKIVIPAGTKSQLFRGVFKFTAPKIALAGATEGANIILAQDVGRFRKTNPLKIGAGAAIGALSAGVAGGGIAGLSAVSKSAGKWALRGAYAIDPFEKVGDVLADVAEKSSGKTIRNVGLITTPSLVFTPSTTDTFTEGKGRMKNVNLRTGKEATFTLVPDVTFTDVKSQTVTDTQTKSKGTAQTQTTKPKSKPGGLSTLSKDISFTRTGMPSYTPTMTTLPTTFGGTSAPSFGFPKPKKFSIGGLIPTSDVIPTSEDTPETTPVPDTTTIPEDVIVPEPTPVPDITNIRNIINIPEPVTIPETTFTPTESIIPVTVTTPQGAFPLFWPGGESKRNRGLQFGYGTGIRKLRNLFFEKIGTPVISGGNFAMKAKKTNMMVPIRKPSSGMIKTKKKMKYPFKRTVNKASPVNRMLGKYKVS